MWNFFKWIFLSIWPESTNEWPLTYMLVTALPEFWHREAPYPQCWLNLIPQLCTMTVHVASLKMKEGVRGEQFFFFFVNLFSLSFSLGEKARQCGLTVVTSGNSQTPPIPTRLMEELIVATDMVSFVGQLANCLAACFGCLSSHEDPGQPAVDPQH